MERQSARQLGSSARLKTRLLNEGEKLQLEIEKVADELRPRVIAEPAPVADATAG